MKLKFKLRKKFIFLISLVVIIIFSFSFREQILNKIGLFLLIDMKPEKSEMIIILRGDRNYSRTIEGVAMFKDGLADQIVISTALNDNLSLKLKSLGVTLPSQQEQIASILTQMGVPKDRIILDRQSPGGGTLGELKRIRNLIKRKDCSKIIIITSWYHSRRSYLMCKRVFKDDNVKFFIVATKNDISSSSNWWKYRYETINVIEEFPKLLFYYLNSILNISFKDDPNLN